MLYSYCYFRAVLKINQAKGLRDTEYGCSFEPFVFVVMKLKTRREY